VEISAEAKAVSTHPFSVLICGAGYVGSALGVMLRDDGHDVWALCRDPGRVPEGLRPLRADLTQPETLRDLPPTLHHVVFCASSGQSTDDAYRRIYVEGLGNVLAVLAERARPPRVFFTSSTAVYAQNDGSWVNEGSPTEPTRFSGQRTLEAERLLETSGLPWTVLRCSGIYGPGRQRIVDGLKAGTLKRPAEDRYTNRIHRDDVAGVIRDLINAGTAIERLLVSDNDPALYSTVVETLARRFGLPAPPIDPQGVPDRSGGNKRCDNQALRDLGYRFRYPTFLEGYSELF
jgi:nucleoside-diphosphate-sugar epimerase